jgi:hypothetical protein
MGAYLSTANDSKEENVSPEEIYQEYLKILSDRLGVEGDLEVKNGDKKEDGENASEGPRRNQLHLDYFVAFKDYVTHSGEKVAVLFQVGGFYEMYQDDTQGPDIKEIAKITGLLGASHRSYPGLKLLGLPIRCLPKYRDLLLQKNYNVVVMNQIGTPPNLRRVVSSIHTPQTYRAPKDAVRIKTSSDGEDEEDGPKCPKGAPEPKGRRGNARYGGRYGGGQRHLKNVFIKTHEGKTICYNDVFLNDTIEDLKEKVGKSIRMSVEKFYLVYHGRMMSREDACLEDYGYETDHTIDVRLHSARKTDMHSMNARSMGKMTRSGRKY